MGAFGVDEGGIQIADPYNSEFKAGTFGYNGGIVTQKVKNTFTDSAEADQANINGFHDEGFLLRMI
jgi:hypothetical protein